MANMLAKGPVKECCADCCGGKMLNRGARRQHRKTEGRRWRAEADLDLSDGHEFDALEAMFHGRESEILDMLDNYDPGWPLPEGVTLGRA